MNLRLVGAVMFVGLALGQSACSSKTKPPPPPSSSIPPCRLDDPLPIVERTFEEAFKRARELAKLPYTRWAVNPATVDPSTTGLYLVTDARRGGTDPSGCPRGQPDAAAERSFDDKSVRTICAASDGSIYCSAAAIRSIVEHDLDKTSPVSSFLFFLFMHELAHVALGHPGALSSNASSIDLAQPAAITMSQLARACVIDDEVLARETAADDLALKAMSTSFSESPFADGYKPVEALIANSERAYRSALALFDWAADYYGSQSAVRGPITDDVCELLDKKAGVLELPALGGTHPPMWRRVAALMSAIGRAVREIQVPPDADPDLKLGVSILQMNVSTASMRNIALDAATQQFCEMVRAKHAGTLDCSAEAIAARRTINLPPTTSERGQAKHLVFPTWAAHREPDGVPHFMHVSFDIVYEEAANAKEAFARAKSFASLAEQFLVELDEELTKKGGYVVYHNDTPAEWSPPMLSDSYTIHGDLRLILRVDSSFDPLQLPSAKAAIAAGIDVHASADRWSDVKEMLVMQFFLADDPADDNDSKRLMSHPQPLDYPFDLEKARAGSPNMMSADFHRLLCYSRARLERAYKRAFALTSRRGSAAFYIGGLNMDFPEEWRPLANKDCPDVSRIDESVVKRLEGLSDYGKDPQDVSEREFKKMFRSAVDRNASTAPRD